jgi:bidirectional [NiFe] hydrogenase diaphorase subunit
VYATLYAKEKLYGLDKSMVTLTIDGKFVRTESRTSLLEAAKTLGIAIPTLCYHEALKPYGACRLCVVEIEKHGRSKLVTSCNYPAEDGLVVFTSNERVMRTRRMLMELLLARCPDVQTIRRLAETMGVRASRFGHQAKERCILCGLCVRVCEEIVGVSAIGFADRGTSRQVSTPLGLASDVCIGCGSCTYICPTGCIEMVGKPGPPGSREMIMADLALKPCPADYHCETCPIDQGFLDEIRTAIRAFREAPRLP